MRVRYQMVGDSTYTAVCDLEDKKARKMYRELQRGHECVWNRKGYDGVENCRGVLGGLRG